MDEISEGALNSQLIPMVRPTMRKQLEKALRSPELARNREKLAHIYVRDMLTQRASCSCAEFVLMREEHVVSVKWAFFSKVPDPSSFLVNGVAYEIDLVPDERRLSGGLISSGRGNGSVRLELEEGFSYFLSFGVWDLGDGGKEDGAAFRKGPPEIIDFHVAIPESCDHAKPRSRHLLNKPSPRLRPAGKP